IGCPIDPKNSAYLHPDTAGDFESCVRPPLLPNVDAESPFRHPRSAIHFTSIDELLNLLPATSFLGFGDIGALNKKFESETRSRVARLEFPAQTIERTPDGRYAGEWRMRAPDKSSKGVTCITWVYLTPEQQAQVANVRPKDVVTVQGTITRCEAELRGMSKVLTVDLREARLL